MLENGKARASRPLWTLRVGQVDPDEVADRRVRLAPSSATLDGRCQREGRSALGGATHRGLTAPRSPTNSPLRHPPGILDWNWVGLLSSLKNLGGTAGVQA